MTTSWRNLWYLSDLSPGDYAVCRIGFLWDVSGHESKMCDASGFKGVVLDTDGEDLFILTEGGTVRHFIDHHNQQTRWEMLEMFI